MIDSTQWYRRLAFAVVLIAALSVLAACGGSDSKSSADTAAATDAAADTGATAATAGGSLVMSFGGSTIALWNDIIKCMQPRIEDAGYQFLTSDPQFKPEKQASDWKAWIAKGDVKAIMGWPISVDALAPATKEATAAGIPVIGYAVAWPGVAASMLTMPEEDGKRLAGDAVTWLNETYAGKPVKVGILADRQNDLTRLRVEGLIAGVKEGYPGAEVFEVTALSRDEGYTAAKAQLTANPDTTVWLSYSDDNLKGVYQALLDSGVAKDDPNYFVAGMDVTNETLDFIGIPNSIYRQAYAFTSSDLCDANTTLLLNAATGKPLEDIYVNAKLVTPENYKDFYVSE